MQPDLSNRFQKFILTQEEEEQARAVSPFFLAYLQNKIADYAFGVVEQTYSENKGQVDSTQQALLDHERRKAQVLVLEELFMELRVPDVSESANQSSTSAPLPNL